MTKDEVEPLRLKATKAVQLAVKSGLLPKINRQTKCSDCGGKATQYDHRDYYKPLEVESVCRKCNAKRGPAHPVPSDWYRSDGQKWASLDGGEGHDVTFSGRLLVDIDLRAIEEELTKAKRIPDPDVRIANFELARLKNVRTYQRSRTRMRIRELAVGNHFYQVEYRRRWATPKDESTWRINTITKFKNLRARASEKILHTNPQSSRGH